MKPSMLLRLAVLVAVGGGCEGGGTVDPERVTPVEPKKADVHPLVGIFDVTTILAQYTDAPGLCSGCAKTGAATGAFLAGWMEVENDVVVEGRWTLLPTVRATFRMRDCSEVHTSCGDTVVMQFASSAVHYPESQSARTISGGSAPRIDSIGSAEIYLSRDTGTRLVIFRNSRLSGDTLRGEVHWATTPARKWYTGSFVALKRR